MYTLKRRQKSFFDAKIKTKELQKGDLVLAYTLKQHASKLKKRGMGPYVIHEISTSGALRLATLDGEQMPNWISDSCRVKKYLRPLTINMLERIHKAKERIQTSLQAKQAAQQEARQRQAQNWIRQHQPQPLPIMQITHTSSTGPLFPQILVDVGAIGLPVTALIDTGADINTISYDLWINLGQPQLKATTL